MCVFVLNEASPRTEEFRDIPGNVMIHVNIMRSCITAQPTVLTSLMHYLALGVLREAVTEFHVGLLMLHVAGLVLCGTENNKCRKVGSDERVCSIYCASWTQ